jgi:hypothetical protein
MKLTLLKQPLFLMAATTKCSCGIIEVGGATRRKLSLSVNAVVAHGVVLFLSAHLIGKQTQAPS